MPQFPTLSRRRFLQETAAFSALAALRPGSAFAAGAAAQAGSGPDAAAAHMLMFGDWGTDKYPDQQVAVSRSMQGWCDKHSVKPGALFLLGDNWYGELKGGFDSDRWRTQFEDMYPASRFPGPAYAVLGNHDYERTTHHSKVDLQLTYGSTHKTRWTMPSKWYTFKYPEQNPLVTFICLDTNLPGTKPFNLDPFSFLMTHDERKAQLTWFQAEIAKPRTTPFVAVIAHHPLYTNGIHRDNPILIADFDKLLRDNKVDFWITGHDHDLQHIEFAGHPTSFVISGGGGAELVDWTIPPERRGPWGGRVLGFSDIEMTPEAITIRHIGRDAVELHAFRKHAGGKVEILSSV